MGKNLGKKTYLGKIVCNVGEEKRAEIDREAALIGRKTSEITKQLILEWNENQKIKRRKTA